MGRRRDPPRSRRRRDDRVRRCPRRARPHRTADAEGRIWYTGNGNGTVGVIEPATGEITEYPMPDPAARDPHSAIVGADGRVFFTLQSATWRAASTRRPATIDLVTMPVAESAPYGIELAPDGGVWIAVNGGPPPLPARPRHPRSRGTSGLRGRHHHPPPRRRLGRHDLVRQLRPRPAWPLRSGDPRHSRMAESVRSRQSTPTPSR